MNKIININKIVKMVEVINVIKIIKTFMIKMLNRVICSMNCIVFKELALRQQRRCQFMYGSVPFSHNFFNGLYPPLPGVHCPNFLDIRNPWGKVMDRSGLGFGNFCSKMV